MLTAMQVSDKGVRPGHRRGATVTRFSARLRAQIHVRALPDLRLNGYAAASAVGLRKAKHMWVAFRSAACRAQMLVARWPLQLASPTNAYVSAS